MQHKILSDTCSYIIGWRNGYHIVSMCRGDCQCFVWVHTKQGQELISLVCDLWLNRNQFRHTGYLRTRHLGILGSVVHSCFTGEVCEGKIRALVLVLVSHNDDSRYQKKFECKVFSVLPQIQVWNVKLRQKFSGEKNTFEITLTNLSFVVSCLVLIYFKLLGKQKR